MLLRQNSNAAADKTPRGGAIVASDLSRGTFVEYTDHLTHGPNADIGKSAEIPDCCIYHLLCDVQGDTSRILGLLRLAWIMPATAVGLAPSFRRSQTL